MSGDPRYLLLNPFRVPVRTFDTPGELEAHIVTRFGATTPEAMKGFTGVRRTPREVGA